MNVGSYVRQNLFRRASGDISWRYGIVIEEDWSNMPTEVRAVYNRPVKVAFSPHKNHPVGVLPYMEYVESSKLEVISD